MRACQKEISSLITYRAEAIAAAFGSFYGGAPSAADPLSETGDPENKRLAGGISYDAADHTFWISRRVVDMAMPNPMSATLYYWPFYQREQLRRDFPVVESSTTRCGLRSCGIRPHDGLHGRTRGAARRGPRALAMRNADDGLARFVKVLGEPIFNENRLDRLWPENFAAFDRRVSGYDDREYLEVQRLGGLLLVRPLIKEFGVLPAFAYVARTPFVVEDDNVRLSALRYQERARQALSQFEARPSSGTAAAKVQPVPPID